ncbi:hypothetical protein MCW82_29915 [Azospirillum doebereinerae]|nr:hypothetical protein [Azospirillum doebereinerae]
METLVPFDRPASEALTAAEQAIIATYAPANGGYGPPRAVEAARRLHREAEAEQRDNRRRSRRTTNRWHNKLGAAWRDLQSLQYDLHGLTPDQRDTIQRALDQIEAVRAEIRAAE